MGTPYIPLNLTPADVDVVLGQIYAEEITPILDALEAAGCPAGELEGQATALTAALAEYFGPTELGGVRRRIARAGLWWRRVRRRARLLPPERPAGTGPAILRLSDLWLKMLHGAVRRERIPVILTAAVRVACVERQVRALVEET